MLSWLVFIWDHVPVVDWPNSMRNEAVPGDVGHSRVQTERQGKYVQMTCSTKLLE